MKQILDNIREILPTDTNWKNILKIITEDSPWFPFVNSEKSKLSLFENLFREIILFMK